MSITGRQKFKNNRRLLNFAISIAKLFPKVILIFMWNLITNHTQIIFTALRFILLKSLVKSCGDNVKVGTNVQILGWNNLTLGSNISIHSNCYIDASGQIDIGDDVSIAHNTSILSSNHEWFDESLPIKYNPVIFAPVKILDDVWVGCGSRILAGVTIYSRSIIAAGAVVNKDVLSRTIVGGVPSKIIKKI